MSAKVTVELHHVATCDWGSTTAVSACDRKTVAVRWSQRLQTWLPVCRRHRGITWEKCMNDNDPRLDTLQLEDWQIKRLLEGDPLHMALDTEQVNDAWRIQAGGQLAWDPR